MKLSVKVIEAADKAYDGTWHNTESHAEAIEAAINAALEAMVAEGNARSGAGAQMPGSSVWIVLDGEGVIHEKQFPVLVIRTEQT